MGVGCDIGDIINLHQYVNYARPTMAMQDDVRASKHAGNASSDA